MFFESQFDLRHYVIISVLAIAFFATLKTYSDKVKVKKWLEDSIELEKYANIVFWLGDRSAVFERWPKSPPISAELIESGVKYIGWELVIGGKEEDETLAFSEYDTPEGILKELKIVIQEALEAYERLNPKEKQDPKVKDRKMVLAQIGDRITTEERRLVRKK